jgi:hypothetical protein
MKVVEGAGLPHDTTFNGLVRLTPPDPPFDPQRVFDRVANHPRPPDPRNEEGRGATRGPSENTSDPVKISGRSEAPQAFV